MLKKTPTEYICPACLHQFLSYKVIAKPRVATKTTDCREVYAGGVFVLPFLVHVCPQCAYAGYPTAFEGQAIDFSVKALIQDHLTWNLKWVLKSSVDKWYHAFRCAEWMEADAKELGDIALNGSWAAQEMTDVESVRYFQRKAVAYYTKAARQYNGVEANEQASVLYIIGELHRRLGDTALAEEWFKEAEATASDATGSTWVAQWAQIQRTAPKEYFT